MNQIVEIKRVVFAALVICTMVSSVSGQTMQVEVNGHMMRVQTAGLSDRKEGQPLVVFELGMGGDPLEIWTPIFSSVAALAPAVAYDRYGMGKSEWDGQAPTPRHVAESLHALLGQINAAPPYILVGHSWGGALVRFFASLYPNDVAGIVYIDPTWFAITGGSIVTGLKAIGVNEELRQEFLSKGPNSAMPPNLPPALQAELEVVINFAESEFASIRSLPPAPSVPIAVILAGRNPPPLPSVPSDDDILLKSLSELNQSETLRIVMESTDGVFIMSSSVSHYIHRDDPALVVEAIQGIATPNVLQHLREVAKTNGAEVVIQQYRSMKDSYPAVHFHDRLLNTVAYDLLRAGQIDDAIAVFELNIEEYPEEPNPHDSLSDAYIAAGRLEEARRSYARAVEVAKMMNHARLPAYETRLEAATQRLKQN
jgi:pimeloyl-ACP methyl ester carboxylesterase